MTFCFPSVHLARLRGLWLSAALLAFAACASAQLVDPDPEWKESQVPPPPAFDVGRAVAIEMPVFVALKFGVDPSTITIGEDRIVRYVMVATSSTGVVNAMYEGIRCGTGEVRTYARYNASSGWSEARNAEWVALRSKMPSHHAAEFARQGACDGRAPADSPAKIVRLLRNPPQQP